ncbi:MAG TPA: cytochrome c [Melioribacteraceae bacterium]|nr:cytochrome c [Melioribacteraceae bacterium]
MTNAQKWMAAFLGLFLIFFIIGRITQKDEVVPHMMDENYNSGSSQQESPELDGLTLIKQSGCVACHGQNMEGTKMAPALAGLKEFWSRDGLINYLRNPSSYSGDKRFQDYKLQYRNIVMPSYGNLDVKDLGKMADYLLSK